MAPLGGLENELKKRAIPLYRALGVDLLPINHWGSDEEKGPCKLPFPADEASKDPGAYPLSKKVIQARIQSPEWFPSLIDQYGANLGVYMGTGKDGKFLHCIDADDLTEWEKYLEKEPEFASLMRKTYTEDSGRGRHYFVFLPSPVASCNFYNGQGEEKKEIGQFLGVGKYAVVAPSCIERTNGSLKKYRVLNAKPILAISREEIPFLKIQGELFEDPRSIDGKTKALFCLMKHPKAAKEKGLQNLAAKYKPMEGAKNPFIDRHRIEAAIIQRLHRAGYRQAEILAMMNSAATPESRWNGRTPEERSAEIARLISKAGDARENCRKKAEAIIQDAETVLGLKAACVLGVIAWHGVSLGALENVSISIRDIELKTNQYKKTILKTLDILKEYGYLHTPNLTQDPRLAQTYTLTNRTKCTPLYPRRGEEMCIVGRFSCDFPAWASNDAFHTHGLGVNGLKFLSSLSGKAGIWVDLADIPLQRNSRRAVLKKLEPLAARIGLSIRTPSRYKVELCLAHELTEADLDTIAQARGSAGRRARKAERIEDERRAHTEGLARGRIQYAARAREAKDRQLTASSLFLRTEGPEARPAWLYGRFDALKAMLEGSEEAPLAPSSREGIEEELSRIQTALLMPLKMWGKALRLAIDSEWREWGELIAGNDPDPYAVHVALERSGLLALTG